MKKKSEKNLARTLCSSVLTRNKNRWSRTTKWPAPYIHRSDPQVTRQSDPRAACQAPTAGHFFLPNKVTRLCGSLYFPQKISCTIRSHPLRRCLAKLRRVLASCEMFWPSCQGLRQVAKAPLGFDFATPRPPELRLCHLSWPYLTLVDLSWPYFILLDLI